MRILCCVLLTSLISACGSIGFPGVYRIDVEQGNIVTQEMVDQLKPAMDRRQVRYILGTPLVEDSFDSSRWDYIYIVRKGRETREQKWLSVYFEGDELSRFSASTNITSGESSETNSETAPVQPKKSIFCRIFKVIPGVC